MRLNQKIEQYVKHRGWSFPTEKEIKQSVPPGLQQEAKEQKLGKRIWIGKCAVYGCKMWYSEQDVKRYIKSSGKIDINLTKAYL